MSERIRLINDYASGDFGISELAEEYQVSRKTVYKWLNRFEKGGWPALEDQSRAAEHHPNAVAEAVERAVLELKARKPLWGAPKLRSKLLEEIGSRQCPAESTISQILKRHGLSHRAKRRRRASPSQQPLSHCRECNQVWSADFKGWFRTGDGRKCTPLTISDNYSRYLLCCQSVEQTVEELTVKPLFIKSFRENGMPEIMRTDNGTPFASTGLGGLSTLSVWWLRLGIRLERIEPGCPQQNGRHERMHRTLKEAAAKPPKADLASQQEAFDRFRDEYNHERPHEALGQRTPSSLYRASVRAYPERLPEPGGYPDDWQKRVVRKGGQMKWKGRDIRVSSALWGQEVGLKPVGNALWAVYFESLELGLFDEQTGHIERPKGI
jgi:transposase InsO family protein